MLGGGGVTFNKGEGREGKRYPSGIESLGGMFAALVSFRVFDAPRINPPFEFESLNVPLPLEDPEAYFNESVGIIQSTVMPVMCNVEDVSSLL
jgi:hypothetical protein